MRFLINRLDIFIIIYLTSLILLSSQIDFFHTIIAGSILVIIISSNLKRSLIVYFSTLIWTLETYAGFNDYILLGTQIVIILKLLKEIYRNNIRFSLIDLSVIIMFISYIIAASFLYFDFSVYKVLINFLLFMLFVIVYRNNKEANILSSIFYVYLLSLNIAIIYGYLAGNFLEIRGVEGVFSNLRYSGVHAPNYMAFYINIGFCMILFSPLKNLMNKYIKSVFFVNMVIALLLTQSTTSTGLFIFLISMKILEWILSNRKKREFLLKSTFAIFIIIIISIFIERFLNLILQTPSIQRLINRTDFNSQLNLNAITNNRFDSWLFYLNEYFDGNIISDFFGKAIFNPYSYYLSNELVDQNSLIGSHSTYIDMLWAVGIFGILVFISFNIYRIIRNKTSPYIVSIVMMKFVLLISMLSTSLMSNRLFFFLLLL